MDRIRKWLYQYLGITLDRETKIVGGIVIGGTLSGILFASLLAITHAAVFLPLTVLSFAVVSILAFGGSYKAVSWSLSSKEGRREIEEEVALKQLRRRVRDKHFQP